VEEEEEEAEEMENVVITEVNLFPSIYAVRLLVPGEPE
jgi:hypothetical protein